ncbi:MAG: oligosaccharyl transferase, archaeosortase A system-associated [Methanophagales archaeon]|nr:oligosaccharyl transferase, archaeosortase A system-associated [Methanophagales archaeon]
MRRIEKISMLCGFALTLLFLLSLYIRVVIPYNTVFTGSFVRFDGTDPWYNMRLVENTLHHFPFRIYFDPFTAYPHGAYNPFGTPLFDLSLASVIWLIGLGTPLSSLGQHGIEVIGAWYPAILGVLTIFPVYLIGKEIYNRGTGLLSAALIAILPGQFLSRSLLGYTDHHAIETLLSTLVMLLFILALKNGKRVQKQNEITVHSILTRNWSSLRAPLTYSSLAGICFGCYLLAWVGAPLFVLILLVYIMIQYIIDHLRGEDSDPLFIISMPVFVIPAAMIAIPVFSYGFLSPFHVIILILGISFLLFLHMFSHFLNKKRVHPAAFPIAIIAIITISLLVLRVFKPSLYSMLTMPLLYVFAPSKTLLTIGEVQPLQWSEIIAWFTTAFFFAFAAIALICYNITKEWKAEEILLIVWSLIILLACFGQKRFAAYYAINVAILCGYLSYRIIEFTILEQEESGYHEIKGKRSKKTKRLKSNKERANRANSMSRFLRADAIAICFVIFFSFFALPLMNSLTMAAKYNQGPDHDWYESLTWMRENTPDTGVDYYALYETPPEDATYNYPESAYSVMNWWDYGNWITYIAHRIPVANNFQQGIGGPYQDNSPGACTFFAAINESEANKVANALDVRYVITDYTIADAMGFSGNKYWGIIMWAKKSDREGDRDTGISFVPDENYFNAMVTRLHIFDGREVEREGGREGEDFEGQLSIPSITPSHADPLHHYRLVYESSSYIIPYAVLNTVTKKVEGWHYYRRANYTSANKTARKLHHKIKLNKDMIQWTPTFISPMSSVKVFEYVKGARIKGRVHNASVVAITTDVTTNRGRGFTYSQRIMVNKSNGSYEFIVPYSTEGPIEGGTNFDVLATPYKIKAGHVEDKTIVWDMEKEVKVREEEVIQGKTIRVDF